MPNGTSRVFSDQKHPSMGPSTKTVRAGIVPCAMRTAVQMSVKVSDNVKNADGSGWTSTHGGRS
jgi:hypothetical protein